MPIPDYVTIPDVDLAPEAPFTSAKAIALRDNMLSVIQGGLNAPRMGPGLMSIGGGIADGILTDVWAPTLAGYYDFDSNGPSVISTPRSMSWFHYVRILGNLTLSTTWTIDKIQSSAQAAIVGLVASSSGRVGGTTIGQTSGGGGGHHGAGGKGGGPAGGLGGSARSLSTLYRWWANTYNIPAGGVGGGGGNGHADGGLAGGAMILMVDGNINMTGGTITAPGGAGSNFGGGGGDPAEGGGGGAGGTVLVFCSGTITGGTLLAAGGAGSEDGGGGAGGAVAMIAKAYAGSQTLTAAAGSGAGSGANGAAGRTEQVTLSDEFINAIVRR